MTLLIPLEETGHGGEAGGVLVKDLLCGEALSPNTHCPTRVAGLLYDDYNAPARWFETISPLNPSRGSSFPSKIGEKHSPRSVHQHKSPFCADDDISVTTARRESTLRRKPAGHGAVLVADFIVSRPTFLELAEAMRMLQEREAQTPYTLTERYIDTLVRSRMAVSSFFEVYPVRRDGVFLIFKQLVEALGLRNLIAAHAIAYLDRFLNTVTVSTLVSLTAGATSATEFQYIATACVSIASKMDASAAPSLASLSVINGTCGLVLQHT